MVKPESSLRLQHEHEANSSSCKFKGVRKRKWGKYVSEIRLPNSRKRIWLGSFDTAEKAARAFDAALFCLRGNSAKFNFPHSLPEIVNSRSLTPEEIRVEAARFANSFTDTGRVENSEHDQSSSVSSLELHVDSPSVSVSVSGDEIPEIPSDTELISFSGGELPKIPSDEEYLFSSYGAGLSEIPLDNEFLNSFLTLGSTGNINENPVDYEIFPGYDDLCVPEMPLSDNFGNENFDFFPVEGSSFLWNF